MVLAVLLKMLKPVSPVCCWRATPDTSKPLGASQTICVRGLVQYSKLTDPTEVVLRYVKVNSCTVVAPAAVAPKRRLRMANWLAATVPGNKNDSNIAPVTARQETRRWPKRKLLMLVLSHEPGKIKASSLTDGAFITLLGLDDLVRRHCQIGNRGCVDTWRRSGRDVRQVTY